jgi:hypothetical protein
MAKRRCWTPSITNVEKEEIVDALGIDGKASMPEQVNQRNPWRKIMMMMMMMMTIKWEFILLTRNVTKFSSNKSVFKITYTQIWCEVR